MEKYDEAYISRIKEKAEVYLKLDGWASDETIKCDLTHFNGIIYSVKYERLGYLTNKYNGWFEIIRDNENIVAYFYTRDYPVLFIGEVSIETHDFVIEEYGKITNWLKNEEERKQKEEENPKITDELEDKPRRKRTWWNLFGI